MDANKLIELISFPDDSDIHWSEWIPLSLISENDDPPKFKRWTDFPNQDGVYIIKTDKHLPRLKGDSDVIKIGQGILKNRVKAYTHKERKAFNAYNHPRRGTARRIRNFWENTNLPTKISYFTMPENGTLRLPNLDEYARFSSERISTRMIEGEKKKAQEQPPKIEKALFKLRH